jgi:hypothetical protein
MARSEWRWLALWTAVALLVVNVPYVLGWAVSRPEMQFGAAVYNVEDMNSYFAKMRQGARGEWLFHIPYTSEDHRGTIIYVFYLLLGKLSPLVGSSLEGTFHLARLVLGAAFLVAAYRFLAWLTPHLAVRRAAFLLLAFSGGLGWLLTLLGRPDWLGMLAIDLILPEGYAFLTLYSPPHIALAAACTLWGLMLVHRACEAPASAPQRRIRLAGGSLALLVTALIGGFYLLVPYAVLGADWLVTALRRRRPDWRALGLIAASALLPAVVVGYTYYVFTFEPVYRTWAAQNLVRSPHPLQYLAGYAILLPLAVLGALWAVRTRRERLQLPMVWLAILPLLLYLPFNLQRRLIIGAQAPLALLAALGLVHVLALPFGRSRAVRWLSRYPRYSRAGMRRFLIVAVVLLTTPTNLLLILGNVRQVVQHQEPIFHSQAEVEALDWLRSHTAPGDTVLCAYETGNYVPARAGNRVVLGLGTETIDAGQRQEEVTRFFDPLASDAWRQELLRRHQVAYLLVGPRERALGAFDPGAASYLQVVYATGNDPAGPGYAIYRVRIAP